MLPIATLFCNSLNAAICLLYVATLRTDVLLAPFVLWSNFVIDFIVSFICFGVKARLLFNLLKAPLTDFNLPKPSSLNLIVSILTFLATIFSPYKIL